MSTSTTGPRAHDWREAGVAWGHAAADWACLFEGYAHEVITAMFPRLGVGPGVRLLESVPGGHRGGGRRAAHGVGPEAGPICGPELGTGVLSFTAGQAMNAAIEADSESTGGHPVLP